ncbi:MAG UNVERIFIED_CONTAM: hypothetical protein LVR18_20125 [Planctomycetaceae bacterium]
MPLPFENIKQLAIKYVADAIGGPVAALRSILIATLSLAEMLARLAAATVVPDLRRLKELTFRRLEAQTDQQVAEAEKKLAEAADAANRANLPKRRDAIARIEQEIKQAEAAKTQAEADAIRMDAETRRFVAIKEAETKLIEALSRLRQDGGDLFVDPDNLRRIIDETTRKLRE